MLKHRAAPPLPSHEEIFLQRYQWLMGSALRLTARDQEQAEDLVHDVFIHFTLDRPELDRVQNLDGYLWTMMRNMHISQIRRAARVRASSVSPSELSISDYDFIADGLHAIERRTQRTQDELRRICQYACIRKETSKAGSVLILRFFHGYYPAEIAQVLRSARTSADKWLQIARSEAKLYLSDPTALGFIGRNSPAVEVSGAAQTTEDFVNELRNVIFKPQDEKCFTLEQLQSLYLSEEPNSIECPTLGHIVSCRQCLDQVNTLLGLPLLNARYPTKALRPAKRGPDKGGGDRSGGASGAGGGTGGDDFISRSRRRLKRIVEHRPQQLRISVNGFIIGSQDVSAQLNKQAISIKGEEKIGFVEVFSEQEVRLLFSNVEPPPEGPIEYRKRVELSGRRSLELTVDFSESWPTLNVTYHDPTFKVAESSVGIEESNLQVPSSSQDLAEGSDNVPIHASRWAPNLKRRISDLRSWASDVRLFSRPGSVTAIFALLLIAVLMLVQLRHPRPPENSAADLLRLSAVADDAVAARTDQVLHRTINLEERRLGPTASLSNDPSRPNAGELIASSRIEIWQSGQKGITARRLYDEKGTLLAGDWRRVDGVETIYHHGAKPQLQLTPEKRSASSWIVTFENAWQMSPSAKEFAALLGTNAVHVEDRGVSYLISYENEAVGASGQGLIRAALTLTKSDLHANEQTFVIRQGDEERAYRYLETSYERRPVSAVAPGVFDPDPVWLSVSGTEMRSPKPEIVMPSLDPGSSTPVVATADLEVEVLHLLHRANADFGEQLSVARTPEGVLQVSGVVETVKRKGEILQALEPMAANRAVKIEIATIAEALEKQKRQQAESSKAITLEGVEVSSNTTPADAELRRKFGNDEAQMRQFAMRVVELSRQALLHAAKLRQLVNRFSPEELHALSPGARAKWLGLIREHANSVQDETKLLRQDLETVFSSSAQYAGTEVQISDDGALAHAAERLFELSSLIDEAMSAGFNASNDATKISKVKSAQFWRSLGEAQALAAQLHNVH